MFTTRNKPINIPEAAMWKIDNTLLPQLRMRCLEFAINMSFNGTRQGMPIGLLDMADTFTHYLLTGEHQLPEKKR